MANVTDFAFRQIVTQCGRPDVFYSEFISCDGICAMGPEKFHGELYLEKSESPIIVQFFGSKPDNFYKCAQLAQKMGYDGIDINMGCPDKSVEKQGGGAALIRKPELAKEVIKATKEGARSTSSGQADLPVSVKTRLGYSKVEIETWIPKLLEAEPAAITIHGRTRKEMSKVPASWDAIGKASKIIRSISKDTLVIGNGDIKDLGDGYAKAKDYKLDGIMVGRGIFENPWFFNPDIKTEDIKPEQRIDLMLEHIKLFEKLWGKNPDRTGKNFDVLKRFFKVYISGWPACAGRPGAKDLRTKIMTARSGQEVKSIVDSYLVANML